MKLTTRLLILLLLLVVTASSVYYVFDLGPPKQIAAWKTIPPEPALPPSFNLAQSITAAEGGDVSVADIIGLHYFYGRVVPQSYLEARYWFEYADVLRLGTSLKSKALYLEQSTYINQSLYSYDHLTEGEKATLLKRAHDLLEKRRGRTLPNAGYAVALAGNYCFQAVQDDFMQWDSQKTMAFNAERQLCVNQVLAEKGDKLATSALQKNGSASHDYLPTVHKLEKLADDKDIPTLARLSMTMPAISRELYLQEFFKSRGIEEAKNGEYPVRIFGWDEAYMPADSPGQFGWLDKDTLIYLGVLYAGSPAPKPSVMSLNLETMHREIDLPEDTLSAAKPQAFKHRADGCADLGPDGSVCRKINAPEKDGIVTSSPPSKEGLSIPQETRKTRLCADVDPTVAVFKTPQGEKEYDFKRPVNLNFKFDVFANQYWLSADMQVWQFSKALEPLGSDTYSNKGIWGNISCAASSGFRICEPVRTWQEPCDILKYSTRAGFLVQGFAAIQDIGDLQHNVIELSSLFLLKKNGRAIEVIKEFERSSSALSISPDGCKAAFMHFPKPRPELANGGYESYDINARREAKLGVLNLCP